MQYGWWCRILLEVLTRNTVQGSTTSVIQFQSIILAIAIIPVPDSILYRPTWVCPGLTHYISHVSFQTNIFCEIQPRTIPEAIGRHQGRVRTTTTTGNHGTTPTPLSSVERRKSEKEYYGDHNNQRTNSFLLLPGLLILDGSAVEWCSFLHNDTRIINRL